MTAHFLNRSGGPCWSRELGYHTPKTPDHIRWISTYANPDNIKARRKPNKPKEKNNAR